MSLVQYQPWSVFDALRRDLDAMTAAQTSAVSRWEPRIDILEYRDRYEILADLPGVDADAVDIDLADGVLTLSGERSWAPIDDAPERVRRERVEGRFERQFTLPRTVQSSAVEAHFDRGVLCIRLPKQVEAQPIKVKVAA